VRAERALSRAVATAIAGLAICAGLALGAGPARADTGFVDGSFTGTNAPSGMKPQSKLWVADGIWWGVMFNGMAQRFEIYRRAPGTETWSSTGTVVDARRNIWADAKWDGTHLFVVTHGASWTSTLDGIRVARYSYDGASKSWSLDAGFPLLDVGTTPGHTAPTGTEGAVLDEDGRGRIWITWTRDLKTWVTHSTTDQRTFVTPFVVPVPGADDLTSDDMSTLVAFDGRIGVLWSNENTWCMCFAVHDDADADGTWTARPMIGPAAQPADKAQELADDHMNLKAPNDGSGTVYAASKTSLDGMGDPLLLLNVFSGGAWTRTVYSTVADQTTRAQIALDLQHKQLYMFNSSPCCNGGVEYYKQSSLVPDQVGFPPGLGTPFISSAANPHANNLSTTKQPVDATTGLVAIAGDDSTKTYLHNVIDLSKADATPPDTSIDSGPAGTDNNPDARFAFSATESGSAFQCSLDGSAFAACSSPKSYSSVGDGSHTFRVRAIDPAGNTDATPATRTWTVENTATAVTIPAEADTYAVSNTTSTNYGTKTTLYTDKTSTADPSDKQSFFRFTVSGTRKIVSAKVRTWVTDGSVAGPSIYATSPTWGESTLTWANKPAPTGSALDTKLGAVAKDAYLDYDVSSAVTGNGAYGFVTITSSTDATVVASRENATVAKPPALQLLVDPPPDTNVDSGPPAVGNKTSATLAFSSTDAGSTFECKLDGGSYGACTSPATYASLADGAHAFSVRATDARGSVDPSPATYSWTIDTAAPGRPTLALAPASDTGSSSSDGITADASPTFTGAAEAGTAVTVTAGDMQIGSTVADASGHWTLDSDDLPAGTHAITATAQDRAGNASAASTPVTVVIDTTPPSVPAITTPSADRLTNQRDVPFSGTAAPGVDVVLSDGSRTAATTTADGAGAWSATVTGLSDGAHDISAVARDVAGNASSPATRKVTVDTAAPDTTIASGPDDPTTSTTAAFSFTSTEAGSAFECSLDGAAFAPCSSPESSSVAGGTHQFRVRATDAAGNADATPAAWSWTVDAAIPPRPTITAPADGSFSASPAVRVAGTAAAGVSVSVVDGTAAAGSTTADAQGAWAVDVSGLADGAHTFRASATNSAGNSGPSAPVTVTVDTQPPATTIDSGPSGPTAASTASFAFSSSETGGRFECALDGAAFAACTSPAELTGLADGGHTFAVRAIDRAGNADPTAASRTWTVDTDAPDTTITSGPTGTVAGAQATFAFTSTDAQATFECRLDGGAFAACASPHTVASVSPGSHRFEVRAVDHAGTADPTPAVQTWTSQQIEFADGFESGDFVAGWSRQVGADGAAAVVTDVVRTGTYAARLSATANTGSFALLRHTLASPAADVTVDQDVQVVTEGPSGANVPLLRIFDATGARQLAVYRQNASADRVYVAFAGTTALTTGRIALGSWAHVRVHVVAGAAGAATVVVSINGTQVYSTTTASVGASVAAVQLGNDTKKQPFQIIADNVSVTLQ
jgi:hypothetical protein